MNVTLIIKCFQKLYFFISYYLNNVLKPVAGIPASAKMSINHSFLFTFWLNSKMSINHSFLFVIFYRVKFYQVEFQKLYFFIKYYLNNILKPVAGIPTSGKMLINHSFLFTFLEILKMLIN